MLERKMGFFEWIRDHKRLMLGTLIVLIFPSFVFWGIALRALPDALGSSGYLSNKVLNSIVAAQLEGREVRQRLFSAKTFRDQLKPTDEELEAFFKQEAKRFEQAALADVDLLTLSVKDLIASERVDAQAVKTFYDQNPQRFGEPEQRRASHILLELSGSASESDRAKALDQAQSILRSIREGKDFAQLARQFSKDSGSAAQGGDLGFFGRDAMVKAFADAVFALKAGELSEPVVSEFGVHIIKLTEIRVSQQRCDRSGAWCDGIGTTTVLRTTQEPAPGGRAYRRG
ncbi:MAG: hypothetical protein EBS52_01075 [Betaproteobacteria bacterium]|nr:hypothetical protein [Betaproteobacteria bacterium]